MYPLLEETRAQVHLSMETIHRAPHATVVSFENAKPYGRKLCILKVDYWRNRFNDHGKEPYKTLPGDLFVLANAKPETVSDLQRVGRLWAFGSVTTVSEIDDTIKVKVPKELEVLKSKTPLFMVFQVNLIPNGRIWKALHMSKNLKVIKEVLSPDSVAQKSICSEKNNDNVNMGVAQNLLSGLYESQMATVLACLEMLHSSEKSAVELIRGPPGTGQTKTIVTLLLTLLQMNCRTLVCAPTNVAITEIASCLVKMVTEVESNALYCSLGKVLLFGNKERLKIGSDIEEIYLDYHLKRLVECLGPQTGWRHCFTSMIECLEDDVCHHRTFLENGLTIEKEPMTTGQMMEKECRYVTKVGKDKCKTFLEFIRDRFVSTASPLRYCISIFCTHMAKNHICVEIFQNMVLLVNLVDSFESLLFQGNVASEALEDIFSRSGVEDISETYVDHLFLLFTNRRECLKVLRKLFDSLRKLDLPDFMKQESLTTFCFQSASLIFCTASSSYKILKLAMEPLSIVVIGEAAQLKECESTIPLQLPGVKHAVLVGDEYQLPATVKSIYRMHPSIRSFPNFTFYNNMILDAPYTKRRSQEKSYLKGSMCGGREENDEDGHSWKNMVKVAIVPQIMQNFSKEWVDSKQNLSTGVVSPFARSLPLLYTDEYINLYKEKSLEGNVNSSTKVKAELPEYKIVSWHGTTVLCIQLEEELIVGVDSFAKATHKDGNPRTALPPYEGMSSEVEQKFVQVTKGVYATLCGDGNKCNDMVVYLRKEILKFMVKREKPTISSVGEAAIRFFRRSPRKSEKDLISTVFIFFWTEEKKYRVIEVGDKYAVPRYRNEVVFGTGSGSDYALPELLLPTTPKNVTSVKKGLVKAALQDPDSGGVLRVFTLKDGTCNCEYEGLMIDELDDPVFANRLFQEESMFVIIKKDHEYVLHRTTFLRDLFESFGVNAVIHWLCVLEDVLLVYRVILPSLSACDFWFNACRVYTTHLRYQSFAFRNELFPFFLCYARSDMLQQARDMTLFDGLFDVKGNEWIIDQQHGFHFNDRH